MRPCIVKLISPLQNDVRCLGSVRMFWIKRAGSILPDARLQESLALQFCGQLFLVYAYNFISVRFFLAIVAGLLFRETNRRTAPLVNVTS